MPILGGVGNPRFVLPEWGTPLGLWLPTHGNMVGEGLHACLWGQADKFEFRFCHFPAGEGARESCLSSCPLPLALCPEAGLKSTPVGSCPGPRANGRHQAPAGDGGGRRVNPG